MTKSEYSDPDATWNQSPPLVTIGIPVFNGAPSVGRAIESALNQTYGNLRVLVSDNASTDETLAICRDLEKSAQNLRIITQSHNLGATKNFNRVFTESQGPFFKWMGHDDILEPHAIESAVGRLLSNPSLSIVHWLERIVDDEGRVLREYTPDQGFTIDASDPAGRFRQMLHWRRFGFGGDPIYGLIRRSALARTRLLTNLLNPNFLLMEELACVGGFETIPEVLAVRRYNDERVTAQRLLKWLDPNATNRFPHFRRFREHVSIGLQSAPHSSLDYAKTWGALAVYGLRPQELKGFAWDLRQALRRSVGVST